MVKILECDAGDWLNNPKSMIRGIRLLDRAYAEAADHNNASEFVRHLMGDAIQMPMLPLKYLERIASYAKAANLWTEFSRWTPPTVYMAGCDHIAAVNETHDPDIHAVLRSAKYRGIPLVLTREGFLAGARVLADRLITPGPLRANQSFDEFSSGLLEFYLQMLRKQFTGNPLNMAMDPRWLNHFWRNAEAVARFSASPQSSATWV